jgi:hypothetical protein
MEERVENTAVSLIITLLSDRWAVRTPLDPNHDAPRTEYALAETAFKSEPGKNTRTPITMIMPLH